MGATLGPAHQPRTQNLITLIVNYLQTQVSETVQSATLKTGQVFCECRQSNAEKHIL